MPENPEPSAAGFEHRSEFHAALISCLRLARRELRLYDPDYASWPLNDTAFLAALEQFLRGDPLAKLHLATRSPGHLMRDCPRLVSLLSRHSDRLQSAYPADSHALPLESILIADSRHAVRLPDSTRPRGVFRENDSASARVLIDRFDEIWQRCDARINVNPLGL